MKKRYNFYLNPHDLYKWTKCPKCDSKTKVRKFCLVLHYDEKPQKSFFKNLFQKRHFQLISLNKSCKYCPNCDLLIGQKPDLDKLLAPMILRTMGNFNPSNYMVLGTLDKKDWVKGQQQDILPQEVFKSMFIFKEVLDFKIQPAGWYFEGE